ncbi:hypothetical protein ACFW04_012235 [Cataglyphis niger]
MFQSLLIDTSILRKWKKYSGTRTYIIVTKDSTKKLMNELRLLFSRWKGSNYSSINTYRSLYISDGILPRAYGLPKIHKRNHPLRIIISHTTINNFYTLISLDVISLFTNIPVELAIESVSKRWDFISINCPIPYTEFILAICFVLGSMYFIFNDTIYQQTFGTSMGSSLSSIIAEIVLQDLEEKALTMLNFIPSFYFRYVKFLFSKNKSKHNSLAEIEDTIKKKKKFYDAICVIHL